MNYRLVKVKNIAECSKGEHSAILSTFIKLTIPFASKIFVLSIFEWPLKGYSRKKIPGGGRRQTIYFSMDGWSGHFSYFMGHRCLKKFDYMGGGVLSENRLLTFDRYIKLNVPVSIKISNPKLPVFLLS